MNITSLLSDLKLNKPPVMSKKTQDSSFAAGFEAGRKAERLGLFRRINNIFSEREARQVFGYGTIFYHPQDEL